MTLPGMWFKIFTLPVSPLQGMDLIWIWIFQKTVFCFLFLTFMRLRKPNIEYWVN